MTDSSKSLQNKQIDTIANFLCDCSLDEQDAYAPLFFWKGENLKPSTTSSKCRQKILSDDVEVNGIILCGSSVLDTVTAAANLFYFYYQNKNCYSSSLEPGDENPLSSAATALNKHFSIINNNNNHIVIFITGGVGHSTHFLYEAVKEKFPRLYSSNQKKKELNKATFDAAVAADNSAAYSPPVIIPEARIFEQILVEEYNVPPEFIVVEDKSTNCGQNAEFCVPLILSTLGGGGGEKPRSPCGSSLGRFILLQDPTMQRRSRLSFERHFEVNGISTVEIASVCVPFGSNNSNSNNSSSTSSSNTNSSAFFCRPLPYSLESRYLPLLLGEIPRLRNDENGYGPRGKNFIGECVIPLDVESAFAELVSMVNTKLKNGEEGHNVDEQKKMIVGSRLNLS